MIKTAGARVQVRAPAISGRQFEGVHVVHETSVEPLRTSCEHTFVVGIYKCIAPSKGAYPNQQIPDTVSSYTRDKFRG